MHYLLALLILLTFSACKTSSSTDATTPSSQQQYVKIFTTAPLINAVVSDDANQTAIYDPTTGHYIFSNPITYPVTVTTNANSFVDVDYDGNKSATDLRPADLFPLKSFCQEVNLLTNLYYSSNYSDKNISTYKNEVANSYGIDLCADPLQNEKNAKTLFGAYNYVVNDGNLTLLDDIRSDVSKVDDFFIYQLSDLDVDKIRYYSSYNALLWLDKQKVSRSDTLHKPNITSILRNTATVQNSYSNLDVRDLFADRNFLYVAAAHDEFATLDKSLTTLPTFNGTGKLDAFGLSLFHQSYKNASCLFLADNKAGILPFKLSSTGAAKQNRIYRYFDVNATEQNLSNSGVVSINGFVSISENKRFLGIATKDKGYYLIDAKRVFTDCNLTTDISASTILIQNSSGYSVSSVFRTDGSYLYVSNRDAGLTRYDLEAPTQANIAASKTHFTLQNGVEAYNLLFYPNSNELLVTTNEGLQLYDVTNDENLTFTGSYKTEGAKLGYFQQVTMGGEYVILGDGTKGVKILKLDSSYTPMLCGAEYFADPSDLTSLKKVTSLEYDSGTLYIGFESGGIESYRLDDLLFRHCK